MPEPGLVGRDAELEVVRRALDAVRRGQRRLVVLRGEAGLGKSRLLDAVADLASDAGLLVRAPGPPRGNEMSPSLHWPTWRST